MVQITNIFKETKEKVFINEQSSQDKEKDEVASLSSVDFVFKRLLNRRFLKNHKRAKIQRKGKISCCQRFLCIYKEKVIVWVLQWK